MRSMLAKGNRWLLPAVLILFILQLVMLPWVVGFAWADRSDSPGHVLTYTKNDLSWDSATGIRADGSAELRLFSGDYSAVHSGNGDKVLAPGSDNALYLRLKNGVSGMISYTAVLYEIKTDARIPVEAVLSGSDFTDTASYTLPQGVTADQVLRAVRGTVDGAQIQDFDMSWRWDYDANAGQDAIDTLLGNTQEPPEVTVGFYIVVEDDNSYVTPQRPPQTGDNSHVGLYLGLMVISLILLILLALDRRREAGREGR